MHENFLITITSIVSEVCLRTVISIVKVSDGSVSLWLYLGASFVWNSIKSYPALILWKQNWNNNNYYQIIIFALFLRANNIISVNK